MNLKMLFCLQLSVIHPDPEVGLKTARVVAAVPGHSLRSQHSVEVRSGGPQLSQQGQQGHLLLALVLLAVSLLLAVLVVGVVRLRANNTRQSSEEQEVEMVSREDEIFLY